MNYLFAALVLLGWLFIGGFVSAKTFDYTPDEDDPIAFFCVLFPTAVVRRVGPLDEQFGWGYCEDDDYCMRLRQAGYRLSLCPGAVVSHPVARTLRHVPEDSSERLARNMDRFEAKWGRRPT